jgi:hypothetical protein
MSRTEAADEPSRKERSKRSISLETFGQKKGHIRALEEFKLRKEKKRVETAKALRRYKKTMKHEGYEAGTGASRKRKAETQTTEVEGAAGGESSLPVEPNGSNRRRKINPLKKALDKAKEKKEETERKIKEREDNLKEKEQKIRERKRQSILLAKRTKRGQPIMKHTVENLLKKLQKQA